MNPTRDPGPADAISRADIAVIGGGVAGLTATRTAARAGAGVVCLEADTRVGGLVGSHRVAGITLDSGAESFATRGEHVTTVADELELPVVTPASAPARILHDDRLDPLPATGVLGIPTDLDAPGLAGTLGTAGLERARRDTDLPVAAAAEQPSLAELVTARMGPAVLDNLVRPIVRGVHSCEPEKLTAEAVLPGIAARMTRTGSLASALHEVRATAPAGSAVAGIDGGVHRLATALSADAIGAGARVYPSTPVTTLRPAGDGWDLRGSDWQLTAAQVIIACAPDRWAFLPADPDPRLAPLQTARDSWPAPQTTDLLTLVVDAEALEPHHQAGTLVADPGHGAKALTYTSAKWAWVADAAGPDQAVLRLSYPPGVIDAPSAATGLRDAARLTGTRGPWPESALAGLAHTRLHPPAPTRSGEAVAHRERLESAMPELSGLYLTGAWLAGTGLATVVPHAQHAARAALGNVR